MSLEKRKKERTRAKKRGSGENGDYNDILKLLDEVRSSFVVARYFLALNQRQDLISSSIETGCEKFEKVKKLIALFHGLSTDDQFQEKIEILEEEIAHLKKFA